MKYLLFYLICTFAISYNLTGQEMKLTSKNKECIDLVLQLDEELGTSRNHSCEKLSLSKTIDNYATGLKQLNFENCPIEFKIAFEKHREAWIDMKKVTDEYLEGRGEMHDLFDKIESGKDSLEFKQLLEKIWSTWGEIEKFTKE